MFLTPETLFASDSLWHQSGSKARKELDFHLLHLAVGVVPVYPYATAICSRTMARPNRLAGWLLDTVSPATPMGRNVVDPTA